MKITIITSTFNCHDDIKINIENVRCLKAAYAGGIEWLVADGLSTDGTVELLESNRDVVDCLISEKDTGIYNAWNKAAKHISGEWVIFMGAGDYFKLDGLLEFLPVLQKVDPSEHTLVYGNVELVNLQNKVLTTYTQIDENDYSCGRPAQPCHQGVFQHQSLFKEFPVFDEKYKIAADSKFLLQEMKNKAPHYINQTISRMQMFGVSTNPVHLKKVMKELDMLNRELEVTIPFSVQAKFRMVAYIKIFLVKVLGYKVLRATSKVYKKMTGKDNLY